MQKGDRYRLSRTVRNHGHTFLNHAVETPDRLGERHQGLYLHKFWRAFIVFKTRLLLSSSSLRTSQLNLGPKRVNRQRLKPDWVQVEYMDQIHKESKGPK
jgi:hypothetical protein